MILITAHGFGGEVHASWTIDYGFHFEKKRLDVAHLPVMNIQSIEASGPELNLLKQNLDKAGIPVLADRLFCKTTNLYELDKQTWFGDHAKYIFANILMTVEEVRRHVKSMEGVA